MRNEKGKRGKGLTRMICAGMFLIFHFSFFIFNSAQAQVGREEYERQRQQMRQQYEQQMQQMRKDYDEARRKAEEEYAAFRRKANEEYAAAMQRHWDMMGVQPAKPKPAEPKPLAPVKPATDRMSTTDRLSVAGVVSLPAPAPPTPAPPIPEAAPESPMMNFELYGTPCAVHTDASGLRFSLPAIDERSVAAAWQQLSLEKYDGLLHDCLAQRDELHLSDWGYMCLLGRASEKLQGKGSNEAVLLQTYLLAQSGYRVRVGRVNGHLVLLMPFSRMIYNYSYIIFDDIPHFAITRENIDSAEVCRVFFPREQVADIVMSQMPELNRGTKLTRTLQAERFATINVTVNVDRQLVDYLNDYPLTDAWDYYVQAGISDDLKASLYPALRSQIDGKSKVKAAFMLLDFLQTAFDYATDDEQFGYERPLFADESFFYPRNDCEDRAILYSILVRDLLGLDVVLVHWPGHLATAVAFPGEVEGDYFELDGRRYTVCDPTYVNSFIGWTMDCYKGVAAKLVRIEK